MKKHKGDSKTSFLDEYDQFLQKTVFQETLTEEELGYRDPFVTKEQKKRDEYITELLNGSTFSNKNTHLITRWAFCLCSKHFT